jgi:hypothetical protein
MGDLHFLSSLCSKKQSIRTALAADFDTPAAMTELMNLMSQTNSYVASAEAGTQ